TRLRRATAGLRQRMRSVSKRSRDSTMDARVVCLWPTERQTVSVFHVGPSAHRLRALPLRGVIHAEDYYCLLVCVRYPSDCRTSSSTHNGSRPKHRIRCTDDLYYPAPVVRLRPGLVPVSFAVALMAAVAV